MTRKDIRHANLLLLVAEFGSIAAVAVAAETSEKYLWQVIHRAPLKSGKPRGIGDVLADKLDDGCGKSPGWMDTNHQAASSSALGITPLEAELLRRFRTANCKHRQTILAVARLDTQAE